MAAITIEIPDELLAEARAADLDISAIVNDALLLAVNRRRMSDWLAEARRVRVQGRSIDQAVIDAALQAAKDEWGERAAELYLSRRRSEWR